MPGDCLAYDVSCPHTIVSPTLTRHEVVIVPKELLQERGFRSAKMLACKLSARTGTGRIAYNFVHAAFDEATKLSPNNAIGVADALIDLLLLPLREPFAMFDRVGPEVMYVRAQFFIREHLRDPDLSIDQISAALSCTKRYLHMLFSDRGTTISDYIRNARLQNCRQELETQAGKTITDVAFSWGFSSSSHFSRVFREYFGIVSFSCDLQGAARWSVPGLSLRIELPLRREQPMSALHACWRVLFPEFKNAARLDARIAEPGRSFRCALFAGCAGVHVDFHADRQFDNFRSFPADSILPRSLTRIPRRCGT